MCDGGRRMMNNMMMMMMGRGGRGCALWQQPSLALTSQSTSSKLMIITVAMGVMKQHTRSMSIFHKLFGGKEKVDEKRKQNLEKRQKLLEEVNRPHPLKEFKENRGKRHEAPTTINPCDNAQLFPSIEAFSMNDVKNPISIPSNSENHVNVVLVAVRAISQSMVKEYATCFSNALEKNGFDRNLVSISQVLLIYSTTFPPPFLSLHSIKLSILRLSF
eukprot:m.86805 g.86805  ORF g.86805 m.86805 type:complete len:217 (+) comp8772_c0_seq6:71-721(+)